VRFSLQTLYPQGDGAQITVQSATPIEMELKLRVPTWSVETSCRINGELCEDVTDGYFRIRRVWNSGDTIALTYASKAELIELNGKIAVKKGAIVMARDERFGESMDDAARVRTVNGEVQYQSITPTEFSAKEVLRLECEDGKFVHVCDYASAGDDWKDGKNKVTVWMSR
ncbi:MAG: glycoside hydrolase family 127 protein, partial [Clostridia bacterium]|nr:glycoside hydrolase family 127 protein [Clostridia bacterium]